MISNDTIIVYQSQEFDNAGYSGKVRKTTSNRNLQIKNTGQLVQMEDNNYRLLFEYFIDFSDKQKMILKETSFSFALSIFSILVVVIIFIVTYRNLRKKRGFPILRPTSLII